MTVRGLLLDRAKPPLAVDVDRRVARSLRGDQLLWVDVSGEESDLARIAEALDVPPALLTRDAGAAAPGLLREKGWIRLTLVAVRALADGQSGGDPIVTTSIQLVAGKNVVVTSHATRVDAIDALEEQFRDEPGLGVLDAAALVAGIVDEVVGIYLGHVEVIERRIDALEELAIRGRSASDYLAEVVALRRRIALLRRALAPHREALSPLARPDFEIAALGRPWPGLMDRLESAMLALQNVRELLVGSVALLQSGTAERANDVMKRLTIINALLLPAIVLAGVMGMNFPMPFFESTANFWLILAMMAGLAITILAAARLRRWI